MNPYAIAMNSNHTAKATFTEIPDDPCADVRAQLTAANQQIATLSAQNNTLENNNQSLVVENAYYGLDVDANYRAARAISWATLGAMVMLGL